MRYSSNPLVLGILYIPSKLYGFIVSFRNLLYDKGLFRAYKPERTLISVGNITVGGTGKTPFVEYLCTHFLEQGKKVAVVSRGYKGNKSSHQVLAVSDGNGNLLARADECGDEPFLLAISLPTAPVVVSANRSQAIREAIRMFDPDLIILDDGYQHRAVSRDVDILLIDATDPFGNYRILPSGILREPIRNIRRADAIIITRAEENEDFITLERILRAHNRKAIIFSAGHRFSKLLAPSGSRIMDPSQLAGKRVFAVCAIGNPEVFVLDIEKLGAEITGKRFFRDHHRYSSEEMRNIVRDAEGSGAEMILTTHKDIINTPEMPRTSLPLYYAQIRASVHHEERFFGALDEILAKRMSAR